MSKNNSNKKKEIEQDMSKKKNLNRQTVKKPDMKSDKKANIQSEKNTDFNSNINSHKKSKKKPKRKKTAKDIILDIIMYLCLFIALGCAIYLGIYFYHVNKSENKFDDLMNLIQDDTVDKDGNPEYEDVDGKKLLAMYAKLFEENNDFVGWITVPDTSIDYPVMYTPLDMEYYIHRDFDKKYSYAGCIFIDKNTDPFGKETNNIILYGHNMKAGTMFHDLKKYESEDFYKEHKIITYNTIYGLADYEVIGAFRTQIYSENDTSHFHYYEFYNADNQEQFDEYMDFIKKNTPYNVDAKAEFGDQLITLSTCAYHTTDGRYVVVAKKIDK